MNRLAAVLGILGVFLVAGTARSDRAHACSADETFDPVATSELIVGGRITGYAVLRDMPGVYGYMPIRISMTVMHVWKGTYDDAPMIDTRSYTEFPRVPGGPAFPSWGGGGNCAAFGADPTGMYAVLGLTRSEDGSWQPNLLLTFYLGPAAYNPAAITAYGRPLALPIAGRSGAASRSSHPFAAWALMAEALASAALLTGALLLRRLR